MTTGNAGPPRRRLTKPNLLMPLKTIASYFLFGGAFLTNQKTIGSVIPSSRFLGRRMADCVPASPAGYVVELGSGTGVITKALLDRGVPMDRLIAVDCSPEMVEWTRKRFPGLRVLLADAAKLETHLRAAVDLDALPVSHIVSSLPLRSLPRPVVEDISGEVRKLLGKHGRMIQFTYDLRPRPHPALDDFGLAGSRVVWLNFPPARVNVYEPAALATHGMRHRAGM